MYDPYVAYCLTETCRKELPNPDRNAWAELVGFEKKRAQGGTNHVAIRRPTGRFMCDTCMDKLQSGVSADQLAL